MPFHQDPVEFDHDDAEPGLVCCLCRTTWCRILPMRTLADVDCPNCGALYADVGRNAEY